MSLDFQSVIFFQERLAKSCSLLGDNLAEFKEAGQGSPELLDFTGVVLLTLFLHGEE